MWTHVSGQHAVRRSRTRLRFAAIGCATALGGVAVAATPLVAHAGSKTITVEPGDSIQAAVDSAHPGDTVKVEDGTYWQQVNITKDDITLKGEGNGTIIKPPKTAPNGNCDAAEGVTGICVSSATVPTDGSLTPVIEGVVVEGLAVQDFPGVGIFVFSSDKSKVEDVKASNNGGYGVFFNNSSHGVVHRNVTIGNGEAGIYYGDSPNAGAWITDNTSYKNGNGIFVRDASHGNVLDNNSWGNCVGILILDTGSGNTDWLVKDNEVNKNNQACSGGGQGPPTSGLGIVIGSASNIHVTKNEVNGNDAGANPTAGTGGIAVFNFGIPENNNTVDHNKLEANSTDIVWDASGTGNTFKHNDCDTSTTPPAAC
jgi:nitrous oxidase accessory protein NosD